jgi:hypothetical protein
LVFLAKTKKTEPSAIKPERQLLVPGFQFFCGGEELKGQVLYSYGPRFIMQQPHPSQLPQESAGDEMQRANVSRLIEPNHDGDGGGGGGCFLGFYYYFLFGS